MTDHYRTVRREGLFELTERGSRFIGICRPLTSEEDALELQNKARQRYPEARHYVYAWRIDSPSLLQRFSDDGEPHGTGGRQLLDALLAEKIDRGAIVVVRYFGGILLGTGGLSRAYAKAARGALSKAGPVSFVRCELFMLETDYAVFHLLENRLGSAGFFQETPEYGVSVRQRVGARAGQTDELRALVMNLSAGAAILEPCGESWIEDSF
ncbi:MAG: YigZ family protein [Clostridiaceae bacterium]|nr:YigZ family protein [Clostridiaceae bacterium]